MSRNKLKAFIAFGLVLLIGMGAFLITSCSGNEQEPEPEETEEVVTLTNLFTGETAEDGYDESASSRRSVAFVVENTPDARPQWGLDDPNYSPDIVLQGEVEGGITRTLWFYADSNKLPEIIGPMRSARPPYIRFSELFDSVFIHWGQSSSKKGEYVGANTVFRKDKVDHINQMTFDDSKIGLYDRDYTRSVSIEHRGILYGSKVPAALEQKGFRTEPKEKTQLSFDPLGWMTAFEPAKKIYVQYSTMSSSQSTSWTYNEEDGKYHTSNFENDFARDNLLVLIDDTEYITKTNYMNSGSSVTYCDYKFKGGKAKLFSKGIVKDVEWRVEDGKLILVDTELTRIARERAEAAKAAEEAEAAESGETDEAEEEEPIEVMASLTKGKTWIGWISGNNGGYLEISKE
ncbi:MAG: DUF3048 domain-containing protein [Mogibacterium sp.]|nr:DUF3048 domain-containing protein [Mogibacterium sp.]